MGLGAVDVADVVSLIVLGLIFLWLDLMALIRARGGHRVIALLLAFGIAWVMAGVILNPDAHLPWAVDIIVWLIPAICILLILRFFPRNRRRP